MRWAMIEGYRYPYRVSDQGEVQKQRKNGTWKTIKPWSYQGQMRVHLRRHDGGLDRPSVSGLVVDHFMGGTPPGMIRAHRNHLKADNSVENIIFRPRGKAGNRPGNCRPVMKVDRDGNVVEIYSSTAEAARKNHISQPAISNRCLGRIKDPYRLDGFNYIFEENRGRKNRAKA